MANPFVAEIRIFPFNFPPKGWAFCDGQILPITQNTALFSLIGTFYGGNGTSTFALPDLQGSVPLHVGFNQPGPGLSNYALGEERGVDSVTLLTSEMPVHNHSVNVTSANANTANPAGALLAKGRFNDGQGHTGGVSPYEPTTTQAGVPTDLSNNALNISAASVAGGSQPHTNLMPYLTLNFCIALQGVFPPRP
jgi:microcystin-dependent protein